MKMSLQMENGSHRYDINRPRPRDGHKYTKCKMCLGIMIVICIEQHLINFYIYIYIYIYIHIITFTRLNVSNLQSPGNLN